MYRWKNKAGRFCLMSLGLALGVCLSSCSHDGPHVCDIDKQLSFLPVGEAIVGVWKKRHGDDGSGSTRISFDDEGHVKHYLLGCANNRFPIEPGGLNTTEDSVGSFSRMVLTNWTVEPGHFRLDYTGSFSKHWLEGTLVNDGILEIRGSPSFMIHGVFVKDLSKPEMGMDGEGGNFSELRASPRHRGHAQFKNP